MEKVYIIEHCANESCKRDFIHETLGVYETLELAYEEVGWRQGTTRQGDTETCRFFLSPNGNNTNINKIFHKT